MKKILIILFMSVLLLSSLQVSFALEDSNVVNTQSNKQQNLKLEISIPEAKFIQVLNENIQKRKIESEERSSWGNFITAFGSVLSVIILIISGIWGYHKFNQERKDKQFIELSNQASSKSSLEKSNAISSLPLLISNNKLKFKHSYKSLNEYLNCYYKKNPYTRESVSIIFNTLIHNSKTTSQEKHAEYSVIRIACSEAFSEITQKTLNKNIKIRTSSGLPRTVVSAVCLDDKKIFKMKFHKVDLTGASLNCAEILQSDLTTSRLDYADLTNSSFIGSCLCRSTLENAILQNANFNSTDLSYCNLMDANLEFCDFTSANLYQTEFINCKNIAKADFTDCVISKESFDTLRKAGVKKYLFKDIKDINLPDSKFIFKLFPDLRNKIDIGILKIDYTISKPADKKSLEKFLAEESLEKTLISKNKSKADSENVVKNPFDSLFGEENG